MYNNEEPTMDKGKKINYTNRVGLPEEKTDKSPILKSIT